VPKAPQPEPNERLKWTRQTLRAVGVFLLAVGIFVSGGWPILILGFILLLVAARLR
jgi:uncharacterized membrane protein